MAGTLEDTQKQIALQLDKLISMGPATGPVVSGDVTAKEKALTNQISGKTVDLANAIRSSITSFDALTAQQKENIDAVAAAQVAGQEATQNKAQRIADAARQMNAAFGLGTGPTDRIIQLNQDAAASYDTYHRLAAERERVASANVAEDPMTWLLQGLILPQVEQGMAAADDRYQRARIEIDSQIKQATNATNQLQQAVPQITAEMAKAKADEIYATASQMKTEADANLIKQKTSALEEATNAELKGITAQLGLAQDQRQQMNARISQLRANASEARDWETKKYAMLKAKEEFQGEQEQKQFLDTNFVAGLRKVGMVVNSKAEVDAIKKTMPKAKQDELVMLGFDTGYGPTTGHALSMAYNYNLASKTSLPNNLKTTLSMINAATDRLSPEEQQAISKLLKQPGGEEQVAAKINPILIKHFNNPADAPPAFQILKPKDMWTKLANDPNTRKMFTGLNKDSVNFLKSMATQETQPNDEAFSVLMAKDLKAKGYSPNVIRDQLNKYYQGALQERASRNAFKELGFGGDPKLVEAMTSYKVDGVNVLDPSATQAYVLKVTNFLYNPTLGMDFFATR